MILKIKSWLTVIKENDFLLLVPNIFKLKPEIAGHSCISADSRVKLIVVTLEDERPRVPNQPEKFKVPMVC